MKISRPIIHLLLIALIMMQSVVFGAPCSSTHEQNTVETVMSHCGNDPSMQSDIDKQQAVDSDHCCNNTNCDMIQSHAVLLTQNDYSLYFQAISPLQFTAYHYLSPASPPIYHPPIS